MFSVHAFEYVADVYMIGKFILFVQWHCSIELGTAYEICLPDCASDWPWWIKCIFMLQNARIEGLVVTSLGML
jgi:hypothetical protein